jgi:small subunit ribosomal protein S9
MIKKNDSINHSIEDKRGTGRRKTAVSSVILRTYKDKKAAGTITVNARELGVYFPLHLQRESILSPLKKFDDASKYDIMIKVSGGGIEAQAIATRLAISRALVHSNEEIRGGLKELGYLTRDPRMKERKKYGQKGARKRFQFSKR